MRIVQYPTGLGYVYFWSHGMGWDWIGLFPGISGMLCCVGVVGVRYSADVDAFVDSIGDGCRLSIAIL